MFTQPINVSTGYTTQEKVRVSRNVGKIEDSSSSIRFVSYTMIAVSLALVAYKAIATVA